MFHRGRAEGLPFELAPVLRIRREPLLDLQEPSDRANRLPSPTSTVRVQAGHRWAVSITARRWVPPYELGAAYLGIGDPERVIEFPEAGRDEVYCRIPFINVDSVFCPLKSHQRFVRLARALSLDWNDVE